MQIFKNIKIQKICLYTALCCMYSTTRNSSLNDEPNKCYRIYENDMIQILTYFGSTKLK